MASVDARELYEQDFFRWTQSNAALLRAGCFQELDIEHLAEEIEDMGRRERNQLESRCEVLLAHLLKWKFQPERRGASWGATIALQRSKVARLLGQMPSLRACLPEALPAIYRHAVLIAVKQTRLPQDRFPATCPFTLEDMQAKQAAIQQPDHQALRGFSAWARHRASRTTPSRRSVSAPSTARPSEASR
jgi:hypothetical protein